MAIAVAVAALVAVAFLISSSASSAASSSSIDITGDEGDNVPAPSVFQTIEDDVALSDITSDRSTWPTGDKIWQIAQAIAHAEGADVSGTNPDKLNNPGDISDGATQFGAEFHSGSNITHFPDKHTGWTWLYNKLANINAGRSRVYSRTMTWQEIAHDPATGATRWAGDWQNWSNNVAADLGVEPTSTFADFMDS